MQAPKTETLLKRDSNTDFFLWNLQIFSRKLCFTEHLQWLLLTVSGFQSVTLLKKSLRQRYFLVSFAKFLRTSFLLTEHLRITPSCVYLWILRNFSEHFFYRAPLVNCLFRVQVAPNYCCWNIAKVKIVIFCFIFMLYIHLIFVIYVIFIMYIYYIFICILYVF